MLLDQEATLELEFEKNPRLHQGFAVRNSLPDCRVFCASLLAGGIGIDLTASSAVIHEYRWWNPARKEEVTARVHRMGQKNVAQADEAGINKQLDRCQLAELLRLYVQGEQMARGAPEVQRPVIQPVTTRYFRERKIVPLCVSL